MTDTTITGPVQPEAGVLEHLDPAGLVIETNVRTEGLILGAEFVNSVRTHGVLVPVLGWRDTDGTVHVRAGQRRTLAAREAQVGSIPVYVVQAADVSTAVRIVEQLVENEHRRALTDTNSVAAWPRIEWALLSPHVRASRSDALRECIRELPAL